MRCAIQGDGTLALSSCRCEVASASQLGAIRLQSGGLPTPRRPVRTVWRAERPFAALANATWTSSIMASRPTSSGGQITLMLVLILAKVTAGKLTRRLGGLGQHVGSPLKHSGGDA